MTDKELKELIARVVSEQMKSEGVQAKAAATCPVEDGEVEDLSAVDFRQVLYIPNAANEEEYLRIKAKTAARIGVGRAGPRARTKPYLRFRADHAAAMDAVFTDVPEQLSEDLGLLSVSTCCGSKDEYLTRPDLGRKFSDETAALLRQKCKLNPDVQLIVSDGLSSTAVVANIADLLPSIIQGLSGQKIEIGTPIFVKYGRVGAEDAITEILGSKVTVILLGERPGLASSESLSAYMTYGGYVGIPEANRTVVSNIHQSGTNPAEAGAHIASLIVAMLERKASGLDFRI